MKPPTKIKEISTHSRLNSSISCKIYRDTVHYVVNFVECMEAAEG